MKNKNYHCLNSSWLGTDTSIKSGGVTLGFFYPTLLLYLLAFAVIVVVAGESSCLKQLGQFVLNLTTRGK